MIIRDTNYLLLNLSKTRLSEPATSVPDRTRSYVLLNDLTKGKGVVWLRRLEDSVCWYCTHFDLTSSALASPYLGCRNFDVKTAKKILRAVKAAARAAERKRKKR